MLNKQTWLGKIKECQGWMVRMATQKHDALTPQSCALDGLRWQTSSCWRSVLKRQSHLAQLGHIEPSSAGESVCYSLFPRSKRIVFQENRLARGTRVTKETLKRKWWEHTGQTGSKGSQTMKGIPEPSESLSFGIQEYISQFCGKLGGWDGWYNLFQKLFLSFAEQQL